MSILEAIILAIVEGLTEFLPVSSTGHMIITSALMGIKDDDFTKVFEIAIQLGAILSVVVLYFKRFFKSWTFYTKLFVAFLPTAVLGLLLKDSVEALMGNVYVVASTLLAGGIFLLWVDSIFAENEKLPDAEPDYKSGLLIGFFQALAMVPGVSRSASTIVGGLIGKLNRKSAAEFSFFLAVPTMFAATAKSIWDERELLIQSSDKIHLLLIGNVVAFIVAMMAIKLFIGLLTKHGFKVFGWYRIILGSLLLILLFSGVDLAFV
ncbi:MAG: undecaprenyl-diphosphate phosphatase [Cytophagaceae bacterium]|jgi:undecaprenyl-diphosphatase|nr:undecaprenyl-diphosphate phosphatase [Cytophagaceae bacterium]